MDSTDWNPDIDFEDALEQLPDCNISFSDYTRQIGDGYETINSSENATVDPICRLDLASMIATHQPNKIGILKPANDNNRASEDEIARWLTISGMGDDERNTKFKSNNTKISIPIADGKQAVSGVNNMFVDDDFFKLRAHPSQLLPFPNTELRSNTDIKAPQANASNDKQSQSSMITMPSSNESDFSKLNDSGETADEDSTIFYTPRQLYNIKKKRSKAKVLPKKGSNGF